MTVYIVFENGQEPTPSGQLAEFTSLRKAASFAKKTAKEAGYRLYEVSEKRSNESFYRRHLYSI